MTKSRWWIPNAIGGLLSLLASVLMLTSTAFLSTPWFNGEGMAMFLLQSALACLALFGAGFATAVAPAPSQNASKVASMSLFIVAAFLLIALVFTITVFQAALFMD